MESLLQPYTSIKELIESVEMLFDAKVVDGYQRGKNYHCQLEPEFSHTENKDGSWSLWTKRGFKIIVKMPE